ncbi:MAG TPA: HEAT repeat domain-containing protein, partial [Sedimentisphaerales bacterium]|nr:HEAT repeat domain-containing protein [Sedimentisphaerales bacterium]
AAQGDEAAIAWAGLRILNGDGVDEAIIQALKSAEDDLRPELINVLTDRLCTSALPAFLEEARHRNPAVARAALRGIGALGNWEGLPKVIDQLVETSDQAVREDALRAVIAITRRSIARHESEITGLILQRLDDVDSVPAKCALMRALPAASCEASLKWLQDASTDADGQIRDAAVRAIADYPDPAAAEVLLNIFKSAQDKTHRIIALRGCIRLCKSTDIPIRTAMNLYKQAMTQAETPAEKKLILSGLAETPHPDALRMALEATDQPSVKAEASLAAIALAQRTCAIDPALASTAARKVLSDPELANLHSQARTVIDTIGKFEDFIVAWQVAGPYIKDGSNYSQLLNMPFDPEARDKPVRWRLVGAGTNPEKPYLVDLLALFGGDQRVAYARTWINAGKGGQYTLNIGSDDGVKAWLNGKLAHTNDAARAAVADSDKVPVTLNDGWNCLMLKITQNVLAWEFSVRLTAADGAKIERIEVDCLGRESEELK